MTAFTCLFCYRGGTKEQTGEDPQTKIFFDVYEQGAVLMHLNNTGAVTRRCSIKKVFFKIQLIHIEPMFQFTTLSKPQKTIRTVF